jgi:anthranilate phosphoribosyltransferase
MKKTLSHLYGHKSLSREEAAEVMYNVSRNQYSEAEIASFITVYLMRSVTIPELQGFRDALVELCAKVDLGGNDLVDIVGTGGDGKNTFNISTLSCFIVAGTGHKVAKHGNYGASSVSGSSNVMEQLGYTFRNDGAALRRELDEANICFLHAPLFHSALKVVAPVRKGLGIRTLFNMLGPLVNPARPACRMVGVYNLEMARVYNYLLQEDGDQFAIVHGLDGYERTYSAEELGKRTVSPADLYGGNSVEESAVIFLNILKGGGSWAQNAVVLSNSAMALYCTGRYGSYDDCYQAAVESLESGKAFASLKKLLA